jgi:hypothetical protein
LKSKRAPVNVPVSSLTQTALVTIWALWPPPAIVPSTFSLLVSFQIVTLLFLMAAQGCAVTKLVTLQALVTLQFAFFQLLVTLPRIALIPIRILGVRCDRQSQYQRRT